jgi:hypothetical protein
MDAKTGDANLCHWLEETQVILMKDDGRSQMSIGRDHDFRRDVLNEPSPVEIGSGRLGRRVLTRVECQQRRLTDVGKIAYFEYPGVQLAENSKARDPRAESVLWMFRISAIS